MKQRILIIIIGLLIPCLSQGAVKKDAVTLSKAFLKSGITARPLGMGEAFCGIADDLNAIHWNPAGLAQIKEREASIMHIVWLGEYRQEIVGYAQPSGKLGIIGASLVYLHMDDVTSTDEYGNIIARYTGYNTAYHLTYAYKIKKPFLIGITLKSLTQKVGKTRTSGYGFDLGALLLLTQGSVGLAIQNCGEDITFKDIGDPMINNIKAGVTLNFWQDSLVIAGDVNRAKGGDTNYSIGAEYWVNDYLALRAGVMINSSTQSSFGAGVRHLGYQADYAYLPSDELGNKHRLALTIRF